MIKDLKGLKDLLKLCRAQGVTEINLGTVSFKLGELPQGKTKVDTSSNETSTDDPYSDFPDGELTQEQLMYYSSGGTPENDPENQGH